MMRGNGEPSIFLLAIFFATQIGCAKESLWSFCDLVATSNINNEPKE